MKQLISKQVLLIPITLHLLNVSNPNPANGILKNSTIAVPLKYLNNFAISFEMPLINCKAELKLKWQKHCLLVPASAGNANANPINIFFLPRTQTYVFLP